MKKQSLLILDLDETLIYSSKAELSRKADLLCGNYYVYLRPHLNWFLNEVSKYYDIGIWSTADEDYVLKVVENIIPHDIALKILWDKNWCEEVEYSEENCFLYLKDLDRIKNLNYKPEQITIVDDKPTGIRKMNNEKIIPIIPYKGDCLDNELKQVLKELIKD